MTNVKQTKTVTSTVTTKELPMTNSNSFQETAINALKLSAVAVSEAGEAQEGALMSFLKCWGAGIVAELVFNPKAKGYMKAREILLENEDIKTSLKDSSVEAVTGIGKAVFTDKALNPTFKTIIADGKAEVPIIDFDNVQTKWEGALDTYFQRFDPTKVTGLASEDLLKLEETGFSADTPTIRAFKKARPIVNGTTKKGKSSGSGSATTETAEAITPSKLVEHLASHTLKLSSTLDAVLSQYQAQHRIPYGAKNKVMTNLVAKTYYEGKGDFVGLDLALTKFFNLRYEEAKKATTSK